MKVLKKWRSFFLSTGTYMPIFAPWLMKGVWIRLSEDHPELDIKWPPDPETRGNPRMTETEIKDVEARDR